MDAPTLLRFPERPGSNGTAAGSRKAAACGTSTGGLSRCRVAGEYTLVASVTMVLLIVTLQLWRCGPDGSARVLPAMPWSCR